MAANKDGWEDIIIFPLGSIQERCIFFHMKKQEHTSPTAKSIDSHNSCKILSKDENHPPSLPSPNAKITQAYPDNMH